MAMERVRILVPVSRRVDHTVKVRVNDPGAGACALCTPPHGSRRPKVTLPVGVGHLNRTSAIDGQSVAVLAG